MGFIFQLNLLMIVCLCALTFALYFTFYLFRVVILLFTQCFYITLEKTLRHSALLCAFILLFIYLIISRLTIVKRKSKTKMEK